ncbi:MAG TPA: hypothetical protein DCO75_04785 [Fibrobacteres bacterium]|jgi:outer membrane receptor for ferrienterochelin and colicins|nr:hypothetical protein [Fibrobacterota bacterium]
MKNTIILLFLIFIVHNIFSNDSLSLATNSYYMDESGLSLNQLLNMDVTTVSKSAEKQSDAPGIISVITQDEIRRFGGTTLKDILERVPSLISTHVFFTDLSTISSRADQIKSTSAHVLVLINGRPIREVLEGGVNCDIYNSFPVNVIEKIEVIRGPGSVLYGSDAFTSVINIITKKAEKNGMSLSGAGQKGWGYLTSGDATLKMGDFSIMAGGSYKQKTVWKPKYVSTSGIAETADIPNKGSGAFVNIDFRNLKLMSSYTDWTSRWISFTNEQWKKSFSNIGYNLKISNAWNMDFNATYTYSFFICDNITKKISHNIIGEWTNFWDISDKSKFVIGASCSRIQGKEILLMSSSAGGQLNGDSSTNNVISTDSSNTHISSTSSETIAAKGSKNAFSGYAQIDYRLLHNLKFIGGIQGNKIEHVKADIVPRIGAIWNPVNGFNVKFLYSEAFRAPSIDELYLKTPGVNGNSSLKPEKVSTLDLGASYQTEQASVGITFFRSYYSDIIAIQNTNYSNTGSIVFNGVEAEGAYCLTQSLFIKGSMLYQANKNDSISNLSPIANLSAKAGLSYAWEKGIIASLFDVYQGRPDNRYKGSLSTTDFAYHRLNFHSDFNVKKLFAIKFKPDISTYLNIDNVLNSRYYVTNASQTNESPQLAGPGRELFAGIKLSF